MEASELREQVEAEFKDSLEKKETPEERWQRMVGELVHSRSWSPRKAVRYLNAIARRQIEKQIRRPGLKVARQMFNRYGYIAANAKQLQREQDQREYAAQIQAQLAEMEAAKAVTA